MREHARPTGPAHGIASERGPGLLPFDGYGELISINDDALAWLDELPPEPEAAEAFGVRLPMVVAGALMRAGAIAEQLFSSIHTVRDYVKAIFEKVGVSSRGELVATLFADHVMPTHLTPDAHARIDD